jgi:hypothetical protein
MKEILELLAVQYFGKNNVLCVIKQLCDNDMQTTNSYYDEKQHDAYALDLFHDRREDNIYLRTMLPAYIRQKNKLNLQHMQIQELEKLTMQ